jgi:sigma-B regulation protein RsbU (phosphoserine phosphatase)
MLGRNCSGDVLQQTMRDRLYLAGFLLGSGLLLYFSRGLLARSALVTSALTFAGTAAAAILGVALYRVQLELRASRHELARKEAELNFALEVQRALFPKQFPADGGLEFSAVCVPARGISGDYYDVLPLQDGRLVFTLADISGKGISAAILMSNFQASLHTLARGGHSAGEVCANLNRHLYYVTDDSRFATCFYAEWNRRERILHYVNAGHPLPIVHGSFRGQPLDAGGPPFGIFLTAQFQVGRVSVQPGDLIVLYSDGITEATTAQDEEFGESRLEALIAAHSTRPLAEIQRQVLSAVRDWTGRELADDLTLLLVRAQGPLQEGT